ncbi:MAG: dihydroorotase [Alphaproteobacteria bacterium]|nr:dihydroorotase [Alphaproteobacteria bacterium]
MVDRIEIVTPDDWHLHLRDGEMLKAVLPDTARHFRRAIVMPNLVPPLVRSAEVAAYRERIRASLPEGMEFTPLMTAYLTEDTDPDDLAQGHADGILTAVKLYPAGATTNSASGVRDISRVMPVLERMAEIGLPLCVHGEVTDSAIDIFDRERVFIETVLHPLREALPTLKVVMEHITTSDAADYVEAAPATLAATITTHHLMINRNHILAGGIRPHYYCLPVAKREEHRLALRRVATSGHPRFFLGTDSAPHPDRAKLQACGCAGIYSAPNTMSCLAHVFEEEGALDKLEGFTSLNGPAFYGLAPNPGRLRLIRDQEPLSYPATINAGDETVTVFDPGIDLFWRVDTIS